MKLSTLYAGIFLSFVLTVGSLGQNIPSFSGKVIRDGKPIEGANVSLFSVSGKRVALETKTNNLGEFKFSDIPAGRYLIKAADIQNGTSAAAGRPTWQGELIVNDSNRSIEIDLDHPGSIREEVVVIASGIDQPLGAVSKTVDTIDAQEMRDRADFSLADTLRTIPGFRVQQLGGFGRTASIKTRGLRNQDTAILIDGIRFRDASAITGDASPFLSDLTLTSVSKIEVLRGSGSSLYGTNAIGGVVDFQTPHPASGTHGQISGAFGGMGLGRFRLNLSHGTTDGKFGIDGGLSRTVYTKGIDGQDTAHNTNLQTRVDANPSSRTNISGRIFFSDALVRLNVSPDTLGTLPASNNSIINAIAGVNFVPDANDPDAFQRSRFFSGQLAINQIINSRLLIAAYYQGLKTRRQNDDGPLGPGFQSASTSIFDGTIHTANAHLNWTPTREDTLTVGYEFEDEHFGNEGSTPSNTDNFTTNAGQRSSTLYVQDLVSLLDGNLQLAGGFRAQRYSLETPAFSLANAPYNNLTLANPPSAITFDGAVSYFINRSGTKLRAHVGNGYRVPSLYERFGTFFSSFGTPSFVALGDPFLRPEKTIAADAGIEQYAANQRLRLSATYFYTKLTDTIGFGNVAPNIGTTSRPFGGYINQKGGIARGAEFSAKATPSSSTDVFVSYTYTNSDQNTPQVSGTGILRTLGIPDHQFTLVATQRFRRFWVNFDLVATSNYLAPVFSNSTFNTYIYHFRGNRKGDLTAGYTFALSGEKRTLRIYGTIENVFGYEYFENGFRTAGRTARLGATFGF